MNDGPHRDTVSTTETTFDILEAIREMDCPSIDALAEQLDIAPSTTYRHVSTLVSNGYVVKNGSEYDISLRFLNIGCKKRRENPIYKIARKKVDLLTEESGERAQFVAEEGGKLVYLYYNTTHNAVVTDGIVGKYRLLHYSAAGKAILGSLPDSRVEEIINRHGLPANTENGITSTDDLFNELAEIRERGVAFNDEESIEGLRAVGSSIQGPSDEVYGALSVSGPAHRMQGERYEMELPNQLLGITNEIELNAKYPDAS